ncbi:Mu transposase domain-containing protein [Nesterenkonia populi]|uniref:Mu transposase domain-containing protein n=1 Tax=Nesterenkonia populi TaxID=1591087 RepID=UPI003CCC75AA
MGRLVQVTGTLERVVAVCEGQVVADHRRCWAKEQTITDSAHVHTARSLRAEYGRIKSQPAGRAAMAGTRDLASYDQLFGTTPAEQHHQVRRAA